MRDPRPFGGPRGWASLRLPSTRTGCALAHCHFGVSALLLQVSGRSPRYPGFVLGKPHIWRQKCPRDPEGTFCTATVLQPESFTRSYPETLRSYPNDATQNRTLDCAMTRPSLPIPNHWGVILILQPRCEPPGSASRCSQAHCLVMCHKDERSCRCRVVPRSGTLPPGPLNRCQSR